MSWRRQGSECNDFGLIELESYVVVGWRSARGCWPAGQGLGVGLKVSHSTTGCCLSDVRPDAPALPTPRTPPTKTGAI
jgi:hypothetical protein